MIRVARIELDDPRFEEVAKLDRALLPEAPPSANTEWWVAWDLERDEIAGYAGARMLDDGTWFLSRAGVAHAYRGHGLQKRLIRARVRRGYALGATAIWTYTVPWNAASINSLVACGFRAWSGDNGEINWKHRRTKARGEASRVSAAE